VGQDVIATHDGPGDPAITPGSEPQMEVGGAPHVRRGRSQPARATCTRMMIASLLSFGLETRRARGRASRRLMPSSSRTGQTGVLAKDSSEPITRPSSNRGGAYRRVGVRRPYQGSALGLRAPRAPRDRATCGDVLVVIGRLLRDQTGWKVTCNPSTGASLAPARSLRCSTGGSRPTAPAARRPSYKRLETAARSRG
jgi:hypothetical protein